MKKIFLLSFIVLGLSACTTTITPTNNIITSSGINASEVQRMGSTCSFSLFGILGPVGDNSVIKAAKEAGIRKIVYFDQTQEYLVLFTRTCNRAYGY